MTTLVLFATPGAPDRATLAKYEEALRPLGDFVLKLIPIAGFSSVFKTEAANLRRGDGRLLPATLDKYAPGVSVSKLAFVGYSAGCWYARDGLLTHPLDRSAIDACVFLDGLHGSAAQLSHVKKYADDGGHLIVTHTDVDPYTYPSTTKTAETLRQMQAEGVIIHRDPKPGETMKQQHGRALTEHGPQVLRDHLVPFLVGGRTDSAPPSGPVEPWVDVGWWQSLTIGQRLVEMAGFEFGHNVKEIPGARHNPRILEYSRHCRRGGEFRGLTDDGQPWWIGGLPLPLPRDEDAWCAAFRSYLLLRVLLVGDTPPHGLRVSVRELCADSHGRGLLRLHSDGYRPMPGDAVIYGRNGQSPLPVELGGQAGQGHITTATTRFDDRQVVRCIGGNERDAIRWQDRTLVGPEAPLAYLMAA